MITKTSTVGMTREQWLDERRKSIGGSDIGAILGLNAYSSAYTVWAEKTGKYISDDENEAMRQGRELEDYVAKRFEELSELSVRRCNAIIRNDNAPHLHACIDREVVSCDAGLECKTASPYRADDFDTDNFPQSYYAQCVGYLAVTEKKRWFLAVLIYGRAFKAYQMTTVPDDACPEWCECSVYVSPEEIQALKDEANRFWVEYVKTETEPPVDGSKSSTETLEKLHATSESITVDLFPMAEILAEYEHFKASEKLITQNLDELKAKIMQYIGDADSGEYDKYKVSWKSQTRKTFDVKAFQAEHPDIDLSDYYKTTNLRPFKVTIKEN